MRSFVDTLLEIVVALTTAVGLATLLVALVGLGLGCAVFGCGYGYNRWRGKKRKDASCRRDGPVD